MPLDLRSPAVHLMLLRTFDWNKAKDKGNSLSKVTDEKDIPCGKPTRMRKKVRANKKLCQSLKLLQLPWVIQPKMISPYIHTHIQKQMHIFVQAMNLAMT